jgi:uncharacterized protein (TIGR02217 family)
MAFHDVQLPQEIESGAIGGGMFNTTIFEAASGYEQRNINWSLPRGEWDVGYGLLQKFNEAGDNQVYVDDLTNFFYARRGRAHSFRFRDWLDYDIGDQDDAVNTKQQIGLGDDVTTLFQVFKRYSSGGTNFDRTIYLLESTPTLFVYLDGTLQTLTTHYTVDLNTGLVTFVTAPASTGGTGPGGEEVVSVVTRFHNHVRFDTDHLQISMRTFIAGEWPRIPLREVSGAGV